MDKKKICIVVISLSKGGAERSSALLSIMLNKLGYDVHIVSVLNDIDYEYAGTLLNLGAIKEKDDSIIGRLKRFLVFKNYLKNQKFDFIIDNRTRQFILKEYLINRLLYKTNKVVFVTRSRNFDLYFTKSNLWAKRIFKYAYSHVGVSEEITSEIKKLYKFKNATTINNPVEIENNNLMALYNLTFNEDYILFYGRLEDEVKNISLLMKAYKLSKLPENNIKLLILGDGKDLQMLKLKANSINIVFRPFTLNPFPYIKNAKFTCLTSRFEGYPRVVIESLSVGTPVVSVDCSGSREIVINNYNGLLVKNNDSHVLAGAMNRLVFDEELYQNCKLNAKESVNQLSLQEIGKQWNNLLKQNND